MDKLQAGVAVFCIGFKVYIGVYVGIMEKKMEATIMGLYSSCVSGLRFLRFRVLGLGFRV